MEWLKPATGTTIHLLTLKTTDVMKKLVFLLILSLLSVTSLKAQFAKPLKSKSFVCHNTSPFSMGITGSFAANDMWYTAVNKSILTPYLAPTFGLAAEWNTMRRVSIGLDASYAMRGANEVFATKFLTSYTTSTFARIHYTMTMNGVEARLPITYYFGYDENLRLYVYVAPRFTLWLNGDARWERTYDDGSYAPLVYEKELDTTAIAPFDLSAMVGVGLCNRLKLGQMQFFLKLDVSYGISVLNTFSLSERKAEEEAHSGAPVNNPVNIEIQGWGDLEHETLGKRYLQNVEARLTLLVPLGSHLKDACAFDQKMRRGK